ncbi:TonB-dependent receptor [Sphingomonas cannabina]|uniref:TonB-dependent receptor domain-containing protein n=1 Tax=Sphingomonas cannabina TaxID=2899123 RepID=UPI001F25FACF|nr:TonB-dependent receptor [Sphingomonas cannabina]UIJ46842.1 TonB-dependent receptor [Sphingomonas cannabina]
MGADRRTVIAAARILAAAVLVAAAPALAEPVALVLPAGRLGDAVLALGRQTGTNIAVADASLWGRRVPALRGRYTAREALERLARAANAEVQPAGPTGWRLVARRPEPPRPRVVAVPRKAPPPLPPAPVVEVPQPDIVVTASKRDLTLRDFAGQVSRIDGAELSLGGAGGTDRLVARVASVSSTHLGAGRNKLFIRGIADSSFTGPTQSTVGQYFGDLRLSYNAPDPDLRLTDLAAVEVLEGPQGTLYGAGSLGGIIRLVPNAPDLDTVSGSIAFGGSATWHGAPGADASAVLNVPIEEGRLGLRLVADVASEGGYIDKPLLDRKDVNRTRISGGRAALRFDAGGGWTVDLIGLGQRTRGEDSQYADRDGPPLTRAARTEEGFDADYAQGQVVVAGPIGDLKLSSSTGISRQVLEERYDATLPDQAPRLFVQHNHTTMIAHETRLWRPMADGWGGMVGVSFTHNTTRLSRELGTPEDPQPVTGVENRVDELSLFGEGSVELVPGLTATAGARYTRSELDGAGEDVAPATTETLAYARAEMTAGRVETAFLPSASVIAAVLPRTSIYVRYQEGFRPGGLAVEADFVRRFRNDRASSIEIGARHGSRGSDPFALSASLSYTRWRDIQADFIDATGLPSTANIGDGRIWSLSAAASVRLAPGLRLDTGVSYNDSRIDEPARDFPYSISTPTFDYAIGLPATPVSAGQRALAVIARMNQVPNIARFGGRAGLDYRRHLIGDLSLTANGWVRYVGPSRLGVGPELGARQGDYLDSGLTVRIGTPGIGATLSVTNIADVEGNRFALGTPFTTGRDQITPLRPRTVRLGLDASF